MQDDNDVNYICELYEPWDRDVLWVYDEECIGMRDHVRIQDFSSLLIDSRTSAARTHPSAQGAYRSQANAHVCMRHTNGCKREGEKFSWKFVGVSVHMCQSTSRDVSLQVCE